MRYLTMRRSKLMGAVLTALILTLVVALPTLAHQPFFEDEDIKFEAPWKIDEPTVSTALYVTLHSRDDVDYFTFEGEAGQSILIGMTIPQIEGQENFAPTLALMGSGLANEQLPARVERPGEVGVLLMPPPEGPAKPYFEPFSRTSYWERQEQRVTLPADGRYLIAVWHSEGQVGRYVLVVGDREVRGGDPAFSTKMPRYWTPVPQPVESRFQDPSQWEYHLYRYLRRDSARNAMEDSVQSLIAQATPVAEEHDHGHDGHKHSHGPLEVGDSVPVPTVQIKVIPDSVSGWNLHIQTTNFTFVPERAGDEHVLGEGHAHLYVDGEKVARLYGEWFHLDKLTPGSHEIAVTLSANSHDIYHYQGQPIQDTIVITEAVSD